MKILLVDDSPGARLLLHKILRAAAYRDTYSASSALDAFKCLDVEHHGAGAKAIDLIMMDVRMPEIDGIQACRRIKAVEAFRGDHYDDCPKRTGSIAGRVRGWSDGVHQATVRGSGIARTDQSGAEVEERNRCEKELGTGTEHND